MSLRELVAATDFLGPKWSANDPMAAAEKYRPRVPHTKMRLSRDWSRPNRCEIAGDSRGKIVTPPAVKLQEIEEPCQHWLDTNGGL